MTYKITEWLERYEVNSKGQPARTGDELRAKPLDYIRQKANGRKQGEGYRRLLNVAGRENAMQVFGIFLKCLEIAGDAKRGERGILPPIPELSFLIDVPESQVKNAIEVMIKLNWISENAGNSPQILAAYITKPNPTEHNITEQNQTAGNLAEIKTNNPQEGFPQKIGVGVVSSSETILELDLKVAKSRIECTQELGKLFEFNRKEANTFAKIMKYLSEQCQSKSLKLSIFSDVVKWAKIAKTSTATNKKGLLVQKIKQQTGYAGNGMLL
jgi:hypothetical protein